MATNSTSLTVATVSNNSTSSPVSNKTVKLMTNDEKVFDVPEHIAFMSKTIKDMIADANVDQNTPVPIFGVRSDMMELVLKYCEYHHANPTPVNEDDDDEDKEEERRLDDIIPWDAEFCKLDYATLRELVEAASWLDIKPMFHLLCKNFAILLKGQDVEKMREILGEENDLTPEEQERIRKETEWCVEK